MEAIHDPRGLDTETVDGFARLCAVERVGCFDIDSWRDVEYVWTAVLQAGVRWLVAYNIDYDVAALVKFLPYKLKVLLYKGLEVRYGAVSLLYRSGKLLKVSKGNARLYLYDCFQYYGTSLNAAALKWLGQGKADFDVKSLTVRKLRTAEARRYCALDAELAGRLFRRFLDDLPTALHGVSPISPGYLARRAFRDILDANGVGWSANETWRRAFRGGRFECFRRGMFRNVFIYDIRSAYPTEIAALRSITPGQVRYAKSPDPDAVYYAVQCDVDIRDRWTGPLQVTSRSGLALCPSGRLRRQWLTDREYIELDRRGWIAGVRSVCNIYGTEATPFRDRVLEYYARKSKPDGYPYKKLLNSLYGKTCQTVGRFIRPVRSRSLALEAARIQDGTYRYRIEDMRGSNFVLAATITANVRLRLWDVIDANRDAVIACFTDSIVSTRPIPELKLSPSLGDWELKRLDWLYLIGSGIYFYGLDGQTMGRMRGIPLMDASALFAHIRQSGRRVSLRSKHRYSFPAAYGDLKLENMILDVTRYIDLNFDRKRVWSADFQSGADDGPHESLAICYQ